MPTDTERREAARRLRGIKDTREGCGHPEATGEEPSRGHGEGVDMANALAKLYRLSYESESLAVRRAATYLLVKGIIIPYADEREVIDALTGIGCEATRDGRNVLITCPGARQVYTNDDFAGDE